jgi:hypothetical protein
VPRELRGAKLPSCIVHLTFYARRSSIPCDGLYRPIDSDNAVSSFKAGRDSLADAGVVLNDKSISIGSVKLIRNKKQCGSRMGVEVTIETV